MGDISGNELGNFNRKDAKSAKKEEATTDFKDGHR